MVDVDDSVKKENMRAIESEMKQAFIDYSMSVIVSRALPDVRDGLKPVHRRILYAMNDMGLTHSKPHRKSARVVGETLGKYHPHGDQAVYDTMVRMAQSFSLRYPLIDGQGNFGSIDGDSAAAMRYTEARMENIADYMLEDINKGTVDWKDNFDGSLKEPVMLPARLPNLLLNGASGIAVGMATNIPPHNLGEVVDGIIRVIDNPDVSTAELMETIPGPDFPTGGIIHGRAGILKAYSSGKGRIYVRARTETEEKENKSRIIVTEIPYQVNKSKLLEKIARLVKDKKIEGISDLRDESDRKGLRIVIDLKRDAIEDVVLNQLFQQTDLQTTFGISNLAIVNGEPQILGLKEIIQHFIDYRVKVITRRTKYDLEKAQDKMHILEGYMIALENIDNVIKIIRGSKKVEEAQKKLMERFELSEEQSKAILSMRLQKLTGMEIEGVEEDYKETKNLIENLEELLSDKENILDTIKEELQELKEKFDDERRTDIREGEITVETEDLIPEEDVIITITDSGYIKRIPCETYRTQHRGGKGLIGMRTKEEDVVVDAFITSTHNYIMFFTNHGKCFWLKGYKIPEGGRHSKGKAIINLLPRLEEGEFVETAIPIEEFDDEHYLVFSTRKGYIKKTVLSKYSNIRVTGIRAVKLEEEDELVSTRLSDGENTIMIATANGQACRFDENEVRPTGRVTRGVIGIRLKDDDKVVSMDTVSDEGDLLTITENGYGKRTAITEYRKTHRGSKGVRTIITNERNGKVIYVKELSEEEEILLTSREGMVVRIPVESIRRQGRNTMGVRIMRLNEGDKVVSVAKVVSSGEEDEKENDEECKEETEGTTQE
ncbi:MAG: DNA gyrase subunit A [Candidatus Thermoplasmatota archaeon]